MPYVEDAIGTFTAAVAAASKPASGRAFKPASTPTTRHATAAAAITDALDRLSDEEGGSWAALPEVCFHCLEHVQELLKSIGLRDPQLPARWQQQCIKCLQIDPTDGPIMWNGMDLQNAMAGSLGRMLLRYHGMQLNFDAWYNPHKLPPSPQPGVSAVCHSCIVNWVAEGSSMDVGTDHDKMAHCHACLQECEDSEDPQQMDTAVMVEYALASRYLGKFITSPVVRKLKKAAQKELDHKSSRGAKGAKASSAAAASKQAGKTDLTAAHAGIAFCQMHSLA
jgi:hypothetical protein